MADGVDYEADEWDDEIIEQLVQAEELALSSAQNHQVPPPPAAVPQPPSSYDKYSTSHSPPRKLSQQVFTSTSFHREQQQLQQNGKEEEIQRLKTELSRVSKQLTLLEKECLEIKKDRDLKEDQLKFLSSTTKAKDEELCHINSKKVHHGVGIDDHGIPQYEREKSSKELPRSGVNVSSTAVGTQTDAVGESNNSRSKNDLFVSQHHQEKLLDIWNLDQKFGRDLVLKLFSTCEVDLQVLFGHLNMTCPSRTKIDSSCTSDEPSMGLLKSVDAARVSHLYLMLTMISNEMVRFEDLLEAIIALCGLNNETILYRSLRILHAVLKYAFSMKRSGSSRDNIVVVGSSSGHTASDKCEDQFCDSESLLYAGTKRILQRGNLPLGENLSSGRMNLFTPGPALSIFGVDWSSLFEMMCKITTTNHEEHIRLEAVSVMNIIVISCKAYSEREKFGSALFFQSMIQLLKKEAGFAVRKQAVKLLYQLLNCPKVTTALFSGYQGREDAAKADIDTSISLTFEEFSLIMEGLVSCTACTDNSVNELKLRRSAITLVAFLASLGKSGYAIVLNHKHPERNSILACILQSLMSDMDFDASDSAPSFDVFRERTLLLREALILLNRVVSHPQYSVPALQTLTSSRDMASLTVDIAKRLSQKRKCLWQDDNIIKQIRESEITELAQVFKRRVFAFLGDSVS